MLAGLDELGRAVLLDALLEPLNHLAAGRSEPTWRTVLIGKITRSQSSLLARSTENAMNESLLPLLSPGTRRGWNRIREPNRLGMASIAHSIEGTDALCSLALRKAIVALPAFAEEEPAKKKRSFGSSGWLHSGVACAHDA